MELSPPPIRFEHKNTSQIIDWESRCVKSEFSISIFLIIRFFDKGIGPAGGKIQRRIILCYYYFVVNLTFCRIDPKLYFLAVF